MGPELVVTVPVHNQPRWTEQIIDQLRMKTKSWAWFYMVDDASTDKETVEILNKARFRRDLVVDRNPIHSGVAHSWNKGIAWARKWGIEYVAFLNNDIILPKNWDLWLLEKVKKPNIWLSSFCDTEDYWHGHWFMCKTKLFDELGDFTEEFGKYGGEDTDLMYRMREMGYRWQNVSTEGLDELAHYGSASAPEIFATPEDFEKHHNEIQKKMEEKWSERLKKHSL